MNELKKFIDSTRRTRNNKLSHKEQVTNMLLGLNGEVGELTDMFKKMFYQGHQLNAEEVLNEIGDIFFYLCSLLDLMEVDPSVVFRMNVEKLKQRYPNGFEVEKSVNREETALDILKKANKK